MGPQEGHAPRGLEKYRVERASAGDEEGERRGEDAPSPPSDVVSASSPETAAEAKAKATQLKANGARPSVSASLAESNASCDPDAGGDEAVSSGAPAPQPDTEEATPAPREDETPAGDGSGRPSSRAPNTTRKFHTTSFVKGSQTPFDVRLERALSGRGAGA